MFLIVECPHCKFIQITEVRKRDSSRFLCKHCDCKKKIFSATGPNVHIHGRYDDPRFAQKVCSEMKFIKASNNIATDFVSGLDF